jgi:type I restriction enzyme, S subunit
MEKHVNQHDRWIKSKLKEVAKVRYGKGLSEENRNSNGSVPVYGSAGIVGKHDQHLINFPSIVTARKGSIGNNFITTGPFWPIDTVYYFDDIKINLNYLYYFLSFSTFKDTSTTIPSLRRVDLEAIKIRYPEKEENQNEIVDEIESRFSVVDKIEQMIGASLIKAEQLRKSILKSAFEGKLVKMEA